MTKRSTYSTEGLWQKAVKTFSSRIMHVHRKSQLTNTPRHTKVSPILFAFCSSGYQSAEFIFPLSPLNSISHNAFDSQVTPAQGSLSLFNQLQQDWTIRMTRRLHSVILCLRRCLFASHSGCWHTRSLLYGLTMRRKSSEMERCDGETPFLPSLCCLWATKSLHYIVPLTHRSEQGTFLRTGDHNALFCHFSPKK